jgi:opacity protein-like surface antigen
MRVHLPEFVAIVLLGSLLSAQGAADTDDEIEIDPTLVGIYLGGSVGPAWDNFDLSGDFGTAGLASVILGYRGSEYISIESEFEWTPNSFNSDGGDIDTWMASLGFRIHFPIGRIEPYLTYGGGILHVDGRGPQFGSIDKLDFAINGGAGVAVQWTERVSLFAESIYTWPISNVSGFDHVSLRFGLLYKFTEEF